MFWSALNGAGAVVLPFVVFAAFARLLTPAQFAQFALALACLELLKALGPLGLYDVLIAHDERDAAYHRTAAAVFLAGAVVVMLVYGAVLLASGWLFHLAIAPVAHWMSLKILFDYLLLQPQAVLVRRGEVRRLGLRSLVAGCASAGVGLAIGLAVSPISGLAIYYVLNSGVTLAMTVAGTGAMARPRLDRGCLAEMARQAVWASGVRLSAGANNYLDQIVIGFSFGPLAIGSYNLGKRIEVISMTMASSLSQILWQPAFARAAPDARQHDLGKGLASVALVCGVPVMALVVTGERAVPLLFGQQWATAAGIVVMLGLSGLARAFGSVAGAVCAVTRRNGQLLAMSLAAAAMNLLIIVGFARFGLAVTAGLLAGRNCLHSLAMLAMLPELRRRVPGLVLRNVAMPLAVVLVVMALVARLAAELPGAGAWHGFITIALVGAGGAVAGIALLLRKI